MMPKFISYATLAVAIAIGASATACKTAAPADPKAGKPVSGRVNTLTGLSFDFGDGWSERTADITPFTEVFRNPSKQLEMRLAEAPSGGIAITSHGDQMRRGLAVDGEVESAGPTTVEGKPAYKVVVKKHTPTGGTGVVVGLTILYRPDRVTTVYVASQGDEKTDHRAEIDALFATLKIA